MAAALLFNSDGDIINAWTSLSSIMDHLVREAEAAFLAISKASDLLLQTLIIAGDSSLVTESFQLDPLSSLMPWKIHYLVIKALNLLRRCSFWFIIKIPCDDNFVAHSLAIWATAHSFVGAVPPSFLLSRGLWKFDGAKPP
ncbi:hypothetical protein CJ030_MR2G000399 [Morella rubra]|uniref:RNase H type-1 domain-containing protein n=1 Tax=Morella rubra TaxID=262757 RepID=A0A6A1WE47_9ROSI|nr:hypothetical protein CJ030_MR2G000399 [Morella rubra]